MTKDTKKMASLLGDAWLSVEQDYKRKLESTKKGETKMTKKTAKKTKKTSKKK